MGLLGHMGPMGLMGQLEQRSPSLSRGLSGGTTRFRVGHSNNWEHIAKDKLSHLSLRL